ncbi:hypothetical protein Tco_0879223 [Tanacetum coccineum]
MSSSTHPIIILFDSNVEDAFSSINTPDYTPASPNYFPASPGNTFSDPSKDLSKDLLTSLTISPFHDDPYMKLMQAYNATSNESPIPLPRAPIAPPTVLPLSLVSHKTHLEGHEEQIETILNHLDELSLERIKHMEDKIEGLGYYASLTTRLSRTFVSVGSSSLVRSTTPPDYPFDESIFVELDNSLWIIPRPLGSEPVPEEPNKMAPKRTSTSATPAMTQAAIKKLVADCVAVALEAQAATMTNTDNTNRNT